MNSFSPVNERADSIGGAPPIVRLDATQELRWNTSTLHWDVSVGQSVGVRTLAAGGGDAGGAGGDGAAVSHDAAGTEQHGGGGDGCHISSRVIKRFSFFFTAGRKVPRRQSHTPMTVDTQG